MYVGDLVQHEFHESYNFEALVLAAAVTVAINSDLLGYPVVVSGGTATIQTAAQVAAFTATSSCNVIADDTPAVAAFSATPSTAKYRVLRRGPAIVHRQALKTADPAAASYDMAKVIAALLVAGVVVVNETGLTNNI
jgi:hypothetical protein